MNIYYESALSRLLPYLFNVFIEIAVNFLLEVDRIISFDNQGGSTQAIFKQAMKQATKQSCKHQASTRKG